MRAYLAGAGNYDFHGRESWIYSLYDGIVDGIFIETAEVMQLFGCSLRMKRSGMPRRMTGAR